jgi:hypothetical protein
MFVLEGRIDEHRIWPHIEINKGTHNFGCKISNGLAIICVWNHISQDIVVTQS